MQISPIALIQPIPAVDRTTAAPAQAASETAGPKSADPAPTTPKVFTPAPGLRPNVQDYVDIDRTLIALRGG